MSCRGAIVHLRALNGHVRRVRSRRVGTLHLCGDDERESAVRTSSVAAAGLAQAGVAQDHILVVQKKWTRSSAKRGRWQ